MPLRATCPWPVVHLHHRLEALSPSRRTRACCGVVPVRRSGRSPCALCRARACATRACGTRDVPTRQSTSNHEHRRRRRASSPVATRSASACTDLTQVGCLVGGRDAARLTGEEPLGRAGHQRLEHAGRDRHGTAGRGPAARTGWSAGAPPGRGSAGHELTAADLLGGERGEAARGGLPQRGDAPGRPPSVAAPPPARPGTAAAAVGRPGARRDAELLEEARGLLAVVVGDRTASDHEARRARVQAT